MVQLKNALPQYFTDIYEVEAILSAVSKELDRLYDVMNRAFGNLAANTACSAFERWEDDLGLSHYGTDDERRQAILANIALIRTQTAQTIADLVTSFAKGLEVTVTEKGSIVTITVTEEGKVTYFHRLVERVERALPYHLTVDFSAHSRIETGFMSSKLPVCIMEMDIKTGG